MAAADAITAIGKELQSFGVQTSFGPSGTFKKPIISDDGKTWIGVETEDGSKWFAERIIMATGAWSPTLVDLEGQCVSKVRLVPLFCGAPMSGVLMEYDIVLGVRTSETYR